MAKEIPRAAGSGRPHASPITSTWARSVCARSPGRSIPSEISRVSIVGCGTAYMAGLIGKYWIERFARLPVEIDVASEYRYREAAGRKGRPDDLHFAIGRDRRHARFAALRQGAGRARPSPSSMSPTSSIARCRRRRADPGRAGDRRRLDQGLHLPARGAGLPGARACARPRRARRRGRKPRWSANSSPRPACWPRR